MDARSAFYPSKVTFLTCACVEQPPAGTLIPTWFSIVDTTTHSTEWLRPCQPVSSRTTRSPMMKGAGGMDERRDQEAERARKEEEAKERPEDRPGEPGAEGGSGSSEDAKTPFWPSDKDDSPLGDSDQHSSG